MLIKSLKQVKGYLKMIQNVLKFFYFLPFLFLLSCLNENLSLSEERSSRRAEIIDLDKERKQQQEKEEKLEQVANNNRQEQQEDNSRRSALKNRSVLQARVSDRYNSSRISGRDYRGEDECSDDSQCVRKCDMITDSSSERKRCEKLPLYVVEDLENGIISLRNIEDASSVDISPDLLIDMLDLGYKFLQELIEKDMSEGDIKTFLAWVAVNEDISEVFAKQDRGNKIIETAVEELADKYDYENEDVLKMSLLGTDDTFFHLAADENNEYGFGIAYDILKEECGSNINCKKEVICAREYRQRSSNHALRSASRRTSLCRTSSSTSSRSSLYYRNSTCYIQGDLVWSYLNELLDDDEDDGNVADKVFDNTTFNVNECNKFCGSENTKNEGKCYFYSL